MCQPISQAVYRRLRYTPIVIFRVGWDVPTRLFCVAGEDVDDQSRLQTHVAADANVTVRSLPGARAVQQQLRDIGPACAIGRCRNQWAAPTDLLMCERGPSEDSPRFGNAYSCANARSGRPRFWPRSRPGSQGRPRPWRGARPAGSRRNRPARRAEPEWPARSARERRAGA